jgi:hypothetical protein
MLTKCKHFLWLWFVFFLGVVSCSVPAPSSIISVPASSKTDLPSPPPQVASAISDSPLEIPLTLNHGLPEIKVSIGETQIPVILDLGANTFLMLNLERYPDLPITYTGATGQASDAKGNQYSIRHFLVPSVTIGDQLILHQVTGVEFKFDPDWAPPNTNGNIGLNFLRQYNVLLDYQRRRMILTDHNELPIETLENWVQVPFNLGDHESGSLITPCILQGEVYQCLWDTGATASFIRADIVQGLSSATNPSGRPAQFPLGVAWGQGDDARETQIEFMPIEGTRPFFDAAIGANFFLEHLVLIDFAHRVLYYK